MIKKTCHKEDFNSDSKAVSNADFNAIGSYRTQLQLGDFLVLLMADFPVLLERDEGLLVTYYKTAI
jgi:hypothetical protein